MGVVVYQYTRKKFAKIPQITQNSCKYTQNYTQVYFIPEIQRKWYTKYPYLSCNIPYTRFKKPLYNVYPKTLADPDTLQQNATLECIRKTWCTLLTGLLQVVKNSGSEIGSLKYDRTILERSPFGGSFVILTPFCSTDTGKFGDG